MRSECGQFFCGVRMISKIFLCGCLLAALRLGAKKYATFVEFIFATLSALCLDPPSSGKGSPGLDGE